jgi:hypothetical protein
MASNHTVAEVTDISQLTLKDLSRLAQQFDVEPHEQLRSLLAQGVGA